MGEELFGPVEVVERERGRVYRGCYLGGCGGWYVRAG